MAGNWQTIGKWFINNGKKLILQKQNNLEKTNGWWNTVKVNDFDKDGDFEISSSFSYTDYYGYTYSNSSIVKGEWEFSSDKEEIELDFDDGSYQEIEITRLTNKELEGELSILTMRKIFPKAAARMSGSAQGATMRFEAEKK